MAARHYGCERLHIPISHHKGQSPVAAEATRLPDQQSALPPIRPMFGHEVVRVARRPDHNSAVAPCEAHLLALARADVEALSPKELDSVRSLLPNPDCDISKL